jgi:hypothetical protein
LAQLYPRALGSLYVVSYDSQGYGRSILTFPLPEGTGPCIYSLEEYDGPVQSQVNVKFKSQSHVTTDGQSISMSWRLVVYSKSKSKLLYNCQSVSQYVLVSRKSKSKLLYDCQSVSMSWYRRSRSRSYFTTHSQSVSQSVSISWYRGSRSYFTTDSQSVNMSWHRVPLWDLRPDIISCLKFTVLYLGRALSDDRTGLQFAV